MVKPTNICLVQMGRNGLELVRAYPEISNVKDSNEIMTKSLSLEVKDGDFLTTIISKKIAFSSYIFTVPRNDEQEKKASIVAVFDTPNYDSQQVLYTFSEIISELKKNNLELIGTLQNLLPRIIEGLSVGHLQMKVSSVVTVEINYKKKIEEDLNKIAKDFIDDIWT